MGEVMKGSGGTIPESILDGKKILAVDDEPDVLTVLEEEIIKACPNWREASFWKKFNTKLLNG
jgi:hypothetical protein